MLALFHTGSDNGAAFSPCRTWRYALWRFWDDRKPRVAFIGLNPSTADESKDDPTIRRCITFSKKWGFGGMYMLNLYAFRATKPIDMVQSADPVGPENQELLGAYAAGSELVIAAWGSIEVRYRPRLEWQTRIKATLASIAKPVYCLGRTQDGSPRHPLYVRGDTQREVFTANGAANGGY